jgi:hypothetical protein
MYSFSAFAFKIFKMYFYDPKIFFLENINIGIQKTQNFLISNSLMPTSTNAPKKGYSQKTMRILSIFVFVQFFVVFCFYLLLGTFLKAGINEIEISVKFCVCLIPISLYFKKKKFWVIIALFANFKCKCEKNYIFKHFPTSIILRIIPIEIPKIV